jgi:hypothetical protein
MAKVTHKQRVLDSMQNGRSISPWYAINELGNTRLASTIHSLKKDGYNITTEIVEGINKFGDKIHYAKYKLDKQAD